MRVGRAHHRQIIAVHLQYHKIVSGPLKRVVNNDWNYLYDISYTFFVFIILLFVCFI